MPSTSSFLDLKAELAKQEEVFARSKAAGKTSYVKGGVKRPDKKPTIWARPNKGVAARSARDLEWSIADRPVLEAAKDVLHRKAAQYEKLKKGKTAGLSEQQFDSLLVDFDRKAEEEGYESDSSEDVDESLTVPQRPNDEDDPVVEYEDEFGRMRTAKRSELPRNLLPPDKDSEPEFDPYVISDPSYFPTYQASAEKVAEVEAALRQDDLTTHYDASHEVRSRGAAFYQFSMDEETRQAQMKELKKSREETEKAREESGAASGKDIKPGVEKRKREIEERRKAIEAKRRKKEGVNDPPVPVPPVTIAEVSKSEEKTITNLQSKVKALENSRSRHESKSKEDIARSADEFLASLERDIMAAKGK